MMPPRLDIRRTPEDDATLIGFRMQDGAYAAITVFDGDDDRTVSGKFSALALRINPDPPPPCDYRGPRRRHR